MSVSNVDRILWNRRPDAGDDEGDDAGDIDEIVIHDATVHVEQLDERVWWIGVYKAGADAPYWTGNFTCDAGRMSFTEQENRGIEWDRDDSHDEPR